jgi:molybdopterin-guanine dinucleotide biosynthesis protein A
MRFSGAVLTGGASKRMGADKAFLAVPDDPQQRPLARIAVDALREAGASEVLTIGGDGDRLRADVDDRLRHVDDTWPGEGPLGGITTALASAREPVVVVLACDLPHVTAGAVRAVLDGMEFGADAAVPVDGDGTRHVLLAAYRRTCRTIFEVAMAVGVRAPREVLDGLDVVDVTLADASWADNANTPADL